MIDKIEVEGSAFRQALAGLIDANADFTPLMRSVKEFLRDRVEENFAQEGRPKWAPLSPVTVKIRGNSGPILQRTGGLAASLTGESDATSATVGTNKIQARTLQEGAKKGQFGPNIPWGDIPAREFMKLTDGDAQDLVGIAIDYEKNSAS